jgi:hypothetical protein
VSAESVADESSRMEFAWQTSREFFAAEQGEYYEYYYCYHIDAR